MSPHPSLPPELPARCWASAALRLWDGLPLAQSLFPPFSSGRVKDGDCIVGKIKQDLYYSD